MATGKIVRWNAEKGFGWAKLDDGKEWFIHWTVVPYYSRGMDITGLELINVKTGQGKKGPAVISAEKREDVEKRLRDEALRLDQENRSKEVYRQRRVRNAAIRAVAAPMILRREPGETIVDEEMGLVFFWVHVQPSRDYEWYPIGDMPPKALGLVHWVFYKAHGAKTGGRIVDLPSDYYYSDEVEAFDRPTRLKVESAYRDMLYELKGTY